MTKYALSAIVSFLTELFAPILLVQNECFPFLDNTGFATKVGCFIAHIINGFCGFPITKI